MSYIKDEYYWTIAFILIDDGYLTYEDCILISYDDIKYMYNAIYLKDNLRTIEIPSIKNGLAVVIVISVFIGTGYCVL